LRNENEDDEDEEKEDDLAFGTAMNTKKEEDSQINKGKDNKDKNEGDKKDKEDQKKLKRMRGKEKSKFQHQQKKKKTSMRHFFLKINWFFCIKIFVLAFLGLTYYIFSTVIKSTTRRDYLEVEEITDKTEGIYKDSLEIHLGLIRILKSIIDYIDSKASEENFPNKEVPNIDRIYFPKFGNLLMPIVSASNDEPNSIYHHFNELYNGNACNFLFPDPGKQNDECSKFWNGIITNGMEQSLTQMSVALTSVLDEIKSINKANTTKEDIQQLFETNSYFFKFQSFVEYFFYLAYLKTSEMFNILRGDIVKDIENKFDILLYLYLIVSIFLFSMIILFIFSIKSKFNSFFNFVAIFPLKFISEDEILYRQTLRLEDNLYLK
jgi:hypothetical protein